MTTEEFKKLPAGYRKGNYMKVADLRGYCEGTSDLVVNLTTGEILHWSFVWYKTQFRCTRRAPYDDPGCPGHTDPSARQGHYITAASEEEALAEMRRLFPEETEFDVQRWKE